MRVAVQEWSFDECVCGHTKLDHSRRANTEHSPCWKCWERSGRRSNAVDRCMYFRPATIVSPASLEPETLGT